MFRSKADQDRMDSMLKSGWITTPQAAEILGVTRPRVVQIIHEGRLKKGSVKRVGRDFLLKRETIENHTLSRPTGRPPVHV